MHLILPLVILLVTAQVLVHRDTTVKKAAPIKVVTVVTSQPLITIKAATPMMHVEDATIIAMDLRRLNGRWRF